MNLAVRGVWLASIRSSGWALQSGEVEQGRVPISGRWEGGIAPFMCHRINVDEMNCRTLASQSRVPAAQSMVKMPPGKPSHEQ